MIYLHSADKKFTLSVHFVVRESRVVCWLNQRIKQRRSKPTREIHSSFAFHYKRVAGTVLSKPTNNPTHKQINT